MWDDQDNNVEELIALVADHAVAQAAFSEAVSAAPARSSPFSRSRGRWPTAEDEVRQNAWLEQLADITAAVSHAR
jgi:hypothetical protein